MDRDVVAGRNDDEQGPDARPVLLDEGGDPPCWAHLFDAPDCADDVGEPGRPAAEPDA